MIRALALALAGALALGLAVPAQAGPVFGNDAAGFAKAAPRLAGQRITTRCFLTQVEFSTRAFTCSVRSGLGPFAKTLVLLSIEGVHMRRPENFRAMFMASDQPYPWGDGDAPQVVVSGILSKMILSDPLWGWQHYQLKDVSIERCGLVCATHEIQ